MGDVEVGCSNLDRGLLGRWGSLETVKIGVDEVGAECGVGEKGLPGRGLRLCWQKKKINK